jgi:hypothetical protein
MGQLIVRTVKLTKYTHYRKCPRNSEILVYGSLSSWFGMFLGCRWRIRPADMEGSL